MGLPGWRCRPTPASEGDDAPSARLPQDPRHDLRSHGPNLQAWWKAFDRTGQVESATILCGLRDHLVDQLVQSLARCITGTPLAETHGLCIPIGCLLASGHAFRT